MYPQHLNGRLQRLQIASQMIRDGKLRLHSDGLIRATEVAR
jgi:hypothetical protein